MNAYQILNRGFRVVALAACLTAVPLLTGCMKELTMEDMKAMRPERPVELDRLNMFAGTWSGTGTANIIGMKEPVQISGTSKTSWQADNWYLVEDAEYRMGDMEPMKAIGIWSWDARKRKYRSWFFDSMGGQGVGTARYNEKTQMWSMRAKGSGPMGSTRGKGTWSATGDTMTWTWVEYPWWDYFGLIKIMEMEGSSKRQ